jgi:hypothetical protein
MLMPIYAFSDSSSGSSEMANGENLNVKTHDNPVGITKKYIYIIRNYINSKVYVGQAIDPKQRFKGHIQDRNRKQYSSAIDGAIKKYGKENFYYEILEESTEKYNEREIYWINFFNSVSPNGYNILAGGQDPPVRKGFENHQSKFSEEDVVEIRSLLLNPYLTLAEIASYYKVSFVTISSINKGKTYRQEDIKYPIRNFQCSGEQENMLSEETVSKVIKDIQTTEISLRQIALKYNANNAQIIGINEGTTPKYRREYLSYPLRASPQTNDTAIQGIKKALLDGVLSKQQIAFRFSVKLAVVSNINSGKTYFDENLVYPLKKHEGRHNLGEDVYEEIRGLLLENVSFQKIASKLSLPNLTLVYDINNGKSHRSDKYTYPIQKQTNKFSQELIEKITSEIAHTNKSLNQISKEYDMEKSCVIALKNGRWDKYRLPNYTYPLRKNN